MNIVEFVSHFTDLIPYQFEIRVGGKKEEDIFIDKQYISAKNFKGKVVPYYEYEFGTKKRKDCVPIEEVRLPIDFKVKVFNNPFDAYFVFFDGVGQVQSPVYHTKKEGD